MSNVERKTYKHLTVAQRLKIIEKLEKGGSTRQLASEFGVSVHTIYNIKRNAEKRRQEVKIRHWRTKRN